MRFAALDSWRGLCALLVALYHVPIKAEIRNNPMIQNGFLYVDFFFVLSGFVIAHAWGARLTDGSSAKTFLLRRWGRVWPLHVATLGFLVVLETTKAAAHAGGWWAGSAFQGGNTWWSLITNLLLIQSWHVHEGIYWNFPSWSISAEWAAYLVFAMVAVLAGRKAFKAMVAVGLFSAALFAWLSPDTIDSTYDYSVLRCLSAFCLGMVAYHLWQRLPQPGPWAASALQMVALILTGFAVGTIAHGAVSHLVPLAFGLAVLAFAYPTGFPARTLASAAPRALGDWSYSIYLNHVCLIMVLKIAAVAIISLFAPTWIGMRDDTLIFAADWQANLAVIVFTAVLVAVSAFTHRAVELPAQAWFNRLSSRVVPAGGVAAKI